MEQLKPKIEGIENEILRMETSLVELRRLQEQISTKAAERSALFAEQQRKFAALDEENEGKPPSGMFCIIVFHKVAAVEHRFFQILMRN
jgi:hypothetical protein